MLQSEIHIATGCRFDFSGYFSFMLQGRFCSICLLFKGARGGVEIMSVSFFLKGSCFAAPFASGIVVGLVDGTSEIWNNRGNTCRKGDVKENRHLGGTPFFFFPSLLSPNHWKTAMRESQWQETSFPRRASLSLPLGKAALAPPIFLWGSATKCIFSKGEDQSSDTEQTVNCCQVTRLVKIAEIARSFKDSTSDHHPEKDGRNTTCFWKIKYFEKENLLKERWTFPRV